MKLGPDYDALTRLQVLEQNEWLDAMEEADHRAQVRARAKAESDRRGKTRR